MDRILAFDKVTVDFDDVRALDSVSFDVPRGQTRILFGAAGSGKSVLIKTAIGLVQPSSGVVTLLGEDISKRPEEDLFEIRSRAGVLFQESGLFDSLTIEENVAYPIVNQRAPGQSRKRMKPDPAETERRVREALRFVELEHTLTKFPSELSGGMRRRVGIARAAVTEPSLMLYDSPTAGLDPITANTIIALIVKARDTRKTTSIIVTHRYQDGQILANFSYNPDKGDLEAAPADSNIHERTVFMVFREGKLVFEGTQEELEANTDKYVARFQSRTIARAS
ncbi:MAG TPA: ATP-binding cassette domain-containing protein [Bryobacteraceae bacterium]|nr:ATP-binding cassette domain-containing protein [Bryobacteraceae bacterium]